MALEDSRPHVTALLEAHTAGDSAALDRLIPLIYDDLRRLARAQLRRRRGDSLDTVAATLETLGGDTRMVGLITHVRELADRVPTRFEVTKGPRTSEVIRVDA